MPCCLISHRRGRGGGAIFTGCLATTFFTRNALGDRQGVESPSPLRWRHSEPHGPKPCVVREGANRAETASVLRSGLHWRHASSSFVSAKVQAQSVDLAGPVDLQDVAALLLIISPGRQPHNPRHMPTPTEIGTKIPSGRSPSRSSLLVVRDVAVLIKRAGMPPGPASPLWSACRQGPD